MPIFAERPLRGRHRMAGKSPRAVGLAGAALILLHWTWTGAGRRVPGSQSPYLRPWPQPRITGT